MVSPLCFGAAVSLRAIRKEKSARCAVVVNILAPRMIHSSPSRIARVLAAAMSDPPSGSV